MRQGDKVNISGFGTFSVSSRKARTGRNPKTGESIEISASRAAKFKPGKTLKDESTWKLDAARRDGRLAQRESIGLTSRGSSVQIGYRPLSGWRIDVMECARNEQI